MAVCYNCAVLQKLGRAIQSKRRGKLTKSVIHDNARPHAANVTQDRLQQSLWDVFSLPSYSPDLAQSGFHLFSQTNPSGWRLANEDDIKKEVERWLSSIAVGCSSLKE